MAQETRGLSSEAVVRPPAVEVYAFGPVVVDVARHVVARDGQPIAVAPKTFELLLVLVRSGGRALSRQELVSALWPDTFVEEANLSFQMSTLRRVLGTGGERWIETVPKVGYRFTPEVTRDPAAASTERTTQDSGHGPADHLAGASPATSSTRIDDTQPPTGLVSRGLVLLPLAVMALAALGALAIAAADLTGRVGDRSYSKVTANPTLPIPSAIPDPTVSRLGAGAKSLTSYTGFEGSPSLSPDGVAGRVSLDRSSWRQPGRVQKARERRRPRSPDVIGGKRVKSGMVTGRRPHRLPPGPCRRPVRHHGDAGTRGERTAGRCGHPACRVGVFGVLAWTPDERWLALGTNIGGENGIWLFGADGWTRRRLTAGSDWGPRFASDGRHMVFVRGLVPSRWQLLMVALDAGGQPVGEPIELVDPYPQRVIAAAWEPGDGALVYSSGGFIGSSRLFRVTLRPDRMGTEGAPVPLTFGDQAMGLDIAATGRLVYAMVFRDSGLWRLDLTEPDRGRRGAEVPASTFDEQSPEFSFDGNSPHHSPDGRELAFASTRSGSQESG